MKDELFNVSEVKDASQTGATSALLDKSDVCHVTVTQLAVVQRSNNSNNNDIQPVKRTHRTAVLEQRRRNRGEGGSEGTRPRNVETAGAKVSFRLRNNTPSLLVRPTYSFA